MTTNGFIELARDQINVVDASARNCEERPVLGCVHIRKGYIEACDGYIMVRKRIDYAGEDSILLHARDIKKATTRQSVVKLELGDGRVVEVFGKDGNNIATLKRVNDAVFVDTNSVLPQGPPKFKIALNRSLLLKLINTLDKIDTPVRFYFYGRDNPVIVETEDTEACIMPMKWRE